MVTLFRANGADLESAEITFSCPEGHDVPRDVSRRAVLAVWDVDRGAESRTRDQHTA